MHLWGKPVRQTDLGRLGGDTLSSVVAPLGMFGTTKGLGNVFSDLKWQAWCAITSAAQASSYAMHHETFENSSPRDMARIGSKLTMTLMPARSAGPSTPAEVVGMLRHLQPHSR